MMPQSRFADPHTPVTDRCKAWTAITFREKISVLAKVVPEGSARAMQHVEDALPLGGESASSPVMAACWVTQAFPAHRAALWMKTAPGQALSRSRMRSRFSSSPDEG